MKAWQCTVCKYIHKGEAPPEKCPICGVDASKFIEIDEASIPEKKPRRKPAKKEIKGVAAKPKESIPIKPEDTPFIGKIKDLLIKHHAHPVSVHTPNGILPAAVVLWVFAWLFDSPFLAKVAMINMIFVILALPFVIFTGVLEWQKKYCGAMSPVFKLKILSAALTTTTCIISLVWYLLDPNILSTPKAWVFILINLIMLAAAGIAGHVGGKLVFKD